MMTSEDHMNKSLAYYLALPYTIELSANEDGSWFVRVAELPGCMSHGATAQEAVTNIQEVLPLWLEGALESGFEIPEPRAETDYSGKFVVRIPRSLHRALAENAERDGVSLNQYTSVALAAAVGRATTQQPASARLAQTEDDPYWPGLRASARQALAAMGQAAYAGQLDEERFCSWASNQLEQVQAAIETGFDKEALDYLARLSEILGVARGQSPAVFLLLRAVKLLEDQVSARHSLEVQLPRRISNMAVAAFTQEFAMREDADRDRTLSSDQLRSIRRERGEPYEALFELRAKRT
jgi:antitoxin HicB